MTMKSYIQTFKGSIARIYDRNGRVKGAGFLFTDGRLLTCAHVVNAAAGLAFDSQDMPTDAIELDFPLVPRHPKLSAKVVYWKPMDSKDDCEDIAGLELEGQLPPEVRPVRLFADRDLWGHSFRMFGFPIKRDEGIWISGRLRDARSDGKIQLGEIEAYEKIKASKDKNVEENGLKGFSGTPVWDEDLRAVVGMAVAANKDWQVAFMIPASLLARDWSDVERSLQRTPVVVEEKMPSFRQVKLEAKQKSLRILMDKYVAAYNQRSFTLNEADKPTLTLQLETFEREIEKLEKEIESLS